MARTGKKVTRVEKQAIYEINVVKSCRENYLEKLEELQRKIDETEVQLKLLLERGKLSTDTSEKKALAREIKKIRDNLEIKNRVTKKAKLTRLYVLLLMQF